MVQHIIRADIFELRSIFLRPAMARKKYEQWAKCPLILYAKPSNKRFIITLQNIVILQLASIFWVRVFRNILIPCVRVTLTMSKMFARNICQTIEWEVNYSTAKNIYIYFASIFYLFSPASSSSSAMVAPFASPGIRPVVYRLNQDTTVYYGLVFWRSLNLIW